MDVFYQPISGLNIENSPGANSDTAQVSANFLAGGNNGFHHVPGLESEGAFTPRQISTRETVLCQSRALVAAASRRFDTEYRLIPALNGVGVSNTGGVQTMLLRYLQSVTIPLRVAAAGDFDR